MPGRKPRQKGKVNKMIIAIHDLYGMPGKKAYYRKSGDLFNFAPARAWAQDMTIEECEQIKAHEEWYCKQFNASHMTIENK